MITETCKMSTYVTKRPQNCTKMLTKIQKTTWKRLQAEVKQTTTDTNCFFVISRVKVLLKRPQRDKKVQMFPQFNRAQHFLKYCNHGNPMLLRFAAAQRCDLDTWRTLTFSLCKTVNCVCSQTPVKHKQAEDAFSGSNCEMWRRRREEQNPPNKVEWSP